MNIDIDKLTEQELRDLHHRIVERLRLIQQMRAHGAMMRFSIGDRVSFNADGRRVAGVLVRYNRKTVTVIGDDGARWNVSPGFLTKADPAPSGGVQSNGRAARPASVVVQAAGLLGPGQGHGQRRG